MVQVDQPADGHQRRQQQEHPAPARRQDAQHHRHGECRVSMAGREGIEELGTRKRFAQPVDAFFEEKLGPRPRHRALEHQHNEPAHRHGDKHQQAAPRHAGIAHAHGIAPAARQSDQPDDIEGQRHDDIVAAFAHFADPFERGVHGLRHRPLDPDGQRQVYPQRAGAGGQRQRASQQQPDQRRKGVAEALGGERARGGIDCGSGNRRRQRVGCHRCRFREMRNITGV
ncbi:hypothetical protein D9M72_207040 [compost metagenome]